MNPGLFYSDEMKMVDITHYEVYTDRGDGWKLEERFPVEQRMNAIKYAREKESENISVKLICEKFDVLDNSYQESTEFVSLAQKKKSGNVNRGKGDFFAAEEAASGGKNTVYDAVSEADNSIGAVVKALLKLCLIVVFSLLFAHFVVNLSIPLLEEYLPEESSKTLLFLFFFSLFLLTATPLILKKIPLDVFGFRRSRKIKPIPERKFIRKAQNIFRLYNINENLDPSVIPTYPEADLEDKHYIVDFLSNVIANLDSNTSLNDDFNRFGVKLVIFGGCMELARFRRLNIAQANSLLNEAFSILDGKNYEVAEFYEAKRSYQDNRVAVFLTGVGAYLMYQLIRGENLDKNILRLTFYKWRQQNILQRPDSVAVIEKTTEADKTDKAAVKECPVYKGCLVNIRTRILFNDSAPGDFRQKEDEVRNSVRNIIFNLLGKFNGSEPSDNGSFESIQFSNIKQALRFAVEFLNDSETYVDELNDENLIVAHKLNIITGHMDDVEEKSDYILDLFDNTYDGEILVDDEFYRAVGESHYKFDFLGDKTMQRSEKTMPIYKLMSN